jgi:hypothetical protein
MTISATTKIASTLCGLGLLMVPACQAGSTSETSATETTVTETAATETAASGDTAESTAMASQSAGDSTDGAGTEGEGDSTGGADSTDTGGTTPAVDVDLGVAGDFAILAKSGISTVPPSAITGDVALSPAAATFLTGFSLTADASGTFATSGQVVGRVYASDYSAPTPAELTVAIGDMELAFTDAAGRAPDVTELGAGEIGGMTLDPGVYKWGTGVLIADDVELSGSATDVWIFQIAQNLTLGNGVSISLSGGALPQHVFWQVAGLVEIGTTAHCEGVVLTQTSITLATGASINGRLLAQTAVSLDGSTVAAPGL